MIYLYSYNANGMDTSSNYKHISPTDLTRIEASLKKLLKATKKNQVDQEYLDLLHRLSDSLSELKLIVHFDHEKRLQAIEEYLQEV